MPHWKKRPMELARHCSRSEDGSWCPRDLPLDQSDVGDFKNNIFEIQIPTVLTVFKRAAITVRQILMQKVTASRASSTLACGGAA